MASKILNVLEILSDGKWHTLGEIRQKVKVNENHIQRIAEFLKEYEFILLDEEKKKVKLDKDAMKFLTNSATV